MRPTLAPLADLFRLNTKLFRNTLVGLDEVDATARPNEHTNSAAFIGGHLVETRAWMGRFLGLDTQAPFGGVLEHAAGLDQLADLPKLTAIRPEWEALSEAVSVRLEELTEAQLSSPGTQKFPGVAPTLLGGIGFLLQHESYHIGQLAYLRKYLGLPPMSYR
ncbi:MAG: DinB family protein [Gemmatimonadetes bacterium]|nr:DinB family protein [Gemmatimonadota bacterium]